MAAAIPLRLKLKQRNIARTAVFRLLWKSPIQGSRAFCGCRRDLSQNFGNQKVSAFTYNLPDTSSTENFTVINLSFISMWNYFKCKLRKCNFAWTFVECFAWMMISPRHTNLLALIILILLYIAYIIFAFALLHIAWIQYILNASFRYAYFINYSTCTSATVLCIRFIDIFSIWLTNNKHMLSLSHERCMNSDSNTGGCTCCSNKIGRICNKVVFVI